MSEMVERIAQLIANGGDWQMSYNEEQREFHRARARLAIKAFLSLPEEPGPRYTAGEYSRANIEAMIEDALR